MDFERLFRGREQAFMDALKTIDDLEAKVRQLEKQLEKAPEKERAPKKRSFYCHSCNCSLCWRKRRRGMV